MVLHTFQYFIMLKKDIMSTCKVYYYTASAFAGHVKQKENSVKVFYRKLQNVCYVHVPFFLFSTFPFSLFSLFFSFTVINLQVSKVPNKTVEPGKIQMYLYPVPWIHTPSCLLNLRSDHISLYKIINDQQRRYEMSILVFTSCKTLFQIELCNVKQ